MPRNPYYDKFFYVHVTLRDVHPPYYDRIGLTCQAHTVEEIKRDFDGLIYSKLYSRPEMNYHVWWVMPNFSKVEIIRTMQTYYGKAEYEQD